MSSRELPGLGPKFQRGKQTSFFSRQIKAVTDLEIRYWNGRARLDAATRAWCEVYSGWAAANRPAQGPGC